MSKVIFISGASRGFGKIWAEAFLNEGHQVIASARNTDTLNDMVSKYGAQLLPLRLDVNQREASFAAIKEATDHFGKIDVLINNAGYGLMGSIEETTEEQARGVIETNFFGLLWLTQAVLPVMRAQGNGHIIQVSSVLGLVTWPTIGLYNASKFAIEGLGETLNAEVRDFGIKVTMVEPGAYATDFGGSSAVRTETLPAYDVLKAGFHAAIADISLGKPEATAEAMLTLVNSQNPPLHILLGKDALPVVKQVYANRLSEWEAWQEVSIAAHGS
jgi:NADP-dependent 3-hydroxy acid dehydrogenase YdfG